MANISMNLEQRLLIDGLLCKQLKRTKEELEWWAQFERKNVERPYNATQRQIDYIRDLLNKVRAADQ